MSKEKKRRLSKRQMPKSLYCNTTRRTCTILWFDLFTFYKYYVNASRWQCMIGPPLAFFSAPCTLFNIALSQEKMSKSKAQVIEFNPLRGYLTVLMRHALNFTSQVCTVHDALHQMKTLKEILRTPSRLFTLFSTI